MASSKRKLMQLDKSIILEKINRIEEQEQWLFTSIKDISAGNVTEARKLLEETDRKKFWKHYVQVNSALEANLRTLMQLTINLKSSTNDHDDSDSSSSVDSQLDSIPGTNDDSTSVFSDVSTMTASSRGSISSRSRGLLSNKKSPTDKRHRPADPKGKAEAHCPSESVEDRGSASGKPSVTSVQEGQRVAGHKPDHQQQMQQDVQDSQRYAEREETRVPLGFHSQECASAGTESRTGPNKAGDSATGPELQKVPSNTEQTPRPPEQPASTQPSHPQTGSQQSVPLHCHITTKKQTAVIRPMAVKASPQVEMIVSEVNSPAIFWIQLADSQLDIFAQKLNRFYHDHQDLPIPAPEMRTFCCARFTEDDQWYRARIIGVRGQRSGQPPDLDDLAGIVVDVIYVDYGNCERLSLSRVRVLDPAFTQLPAQAVCCSLAKVKPPVPRSAWGKNQTDFFKTLVLGKKVQAAINLTKGRNVPSLDMSVPMVTCKTPSGDSHIIQVDVAEVMVRSEMALYVAGCGPPDVPLQPPQPPEGKTLPSTGTAGDRSSEGKGGGTKMSVKESGQHASSSGTSQLERSGDDKSLCSSAVKGAQGSNQKQQNQMPQEQKANESTSHQANAQTEDVPPGYFEYEEDKSNPFPRSRHQSSLSWRQVQHSNTQSTSRTEQLCRRQGNRDVPKQATPCPKSKPSEVPTAKASPPCLKRGSPPNRGQPDPPKRQGSWTGRGSRINSSRQAAAPPHNPRKTEQQQFQLEKRHLDSGTRGGPAHPPKSKEPVIGDSGSTKQRCSEKAVDEESQRVAGQKDASQEERSSSPEESGPGRISPNSSSGVSSCHSGQSNTSSTQRDATQCDSHNTDKPHRGRCWEESRKDVIESDVKDILGIHAEESGPQNCDFKTDDSIKQMDQARPVSEESLNKPLSASSRNLSSSVSSFVTAVTDLDTFQSDSSLAQYGKTDSRASSHSSSSSTMSRCMKTKKRDGAKSPLTLHPQLGQWNGLPVQDGCLKLEMSHIVSPLEFYVHLITPKAYMLDVLARDLNEWYNSEEGAWTEEPILEQGALCAAKFIEDGMWYRAKILHIGEEKAGTECPKDAKSNLMVKVLYIDFGNKEWLAADMLRPLRPAFYELPQQAIKCSLAHIEPPTKVDSWEIDAAKSEGNTQSRDGEAEVWPDNIAEELAKMTGYDKFLLGRITGDYDLHNDEPVQLILLDPSSLWEICINQELVNLGLASSSRFVPQPPPEDTSKPAEVTDRQLLMASECWSLKKYAEGGYDPVPEQSVEGQAEGNSQVVPTGQWDPLLSDFQSAHNSYHIDTDNPDVATGGHNVESIRQVCKFYSTGRVCYRGKQCPFDHVRRVEKCQSSSKQLVLQEKVTTARSASRRETTRVDGCFLVRQQGEASAGRQHRGAGGHGAPQRVSFLGSITVLCETVGPSPAARGFPYRRRRDAGDAGRCNESAVLQLEAPSSHQSSPESSRGDGLLPLPSGSPLLPGKGHRS
ncbi:uncharacterized protein LOC110974069 isoform X2 [Acanthaster planci]|uniref:Uncharacterized protein LOC110974069 isoform X2 n=1 Tax=Acanthaster planci TaxID=133434 RepID=A0A8B7XM96_ACAPL|nr:uncharacterized protein LOC110974069 isoform X2 [Acanthaster planci]